MDSVLAMMKTPITERRLKRHKSSDSDDSQASDIHRFCPTSKSGVPSNKPKHKKHAKNENDTATRNTSSSLATVKSIIIPAFLPDTQTPPLMVPAAIPHDHPAPVKRVQSFHRGPMPPLPEDSSHEQQHTLTTVTSAANSSFHWNPMKILDWPVTLLHTILDEPKHQSNFSSDQSPTAVHSTRPCALPLSLTFIATQIKTITIRVVLQLLSDPVMIKWQSKDTCTDKYLLALATVYLIRMKAKDEKLVRILLMPALYLAYEMEEESYAGDHHRELLIEYDMEWNFGNEHGKPQSAKPKEAHRYDFLQRRLKLWKAINYRAIVSRVLCQRVMDESPGHPFWSRLRDIRLDDGGRTVVPYLIKPMANISVIQTGDIDSVSAQSTASMTTSTESSD